MTRPGIEPPTSQFQDECSNHKVTVRNPYRAPQGRHELRSGSKIFIHFSHRDFLKYTLSVQMRGCKISHIYSAATGKVNYLYGGLQKNTITIVQIFNFVAKHTQFYICVSSIIVSKQRVYTPRGEKVLK